jgi:enoyl-CoA hydratase/carnithine racemase
MALDVRFAARVQAGIGRTEVLMGIVPGGGATTYLPRLIGRAGPGSDFGG